MPTTCSANMKIFAFILLLVGSQSPVFVQSQVQRQTSLPPVITHGDGTGRCPALEDRRAALETTRNNVLTALRLDSTSDPTIRCGAGQWTRVAYLNMSDTLQSCPPAWHLNTSSGIRRCGRPLSSDDMCHGTFYSTGGRLYSKVCGRVIGYQIGHPDAFHTSDSIDAAYVEGVSITHGIPRSHIWTYAGGRSEINFADCPCANGSSRLPPSFVGDNYYCESGNSDADTINHFLYTSDPLWDGQQCINEGTCCSGGNSPPWFSTNLILPTSDSIEVRICADFNISEDTPIQLLELYIQ